jgi:hypothetical protein
MAKRPAGSRMIRALVEVCQSEGIPAPRPLSLSERRTVHQAGCESFVACISESQLASPCSDHHTQQEVSCV